ncbi:undecaprenyl-phosphate glucose phosphotransferase [Marinomonas balearica]|uniref:Putative colanic acid biosynthesis UDP-glucose lipid carrier transferase n=1 Tax=Marinomonas balearica TaxID=491947 RepID=A0A4R6M3X2_9GAMM|nr:undecaprenyl-phosphate glucose phosphotransferase [Marinomonas balearica]TDO95997.1 putative colanic acid biosynthesis UDP-glucose lipid carrier transferase [Marinomonas balearica]
MKAGQALKEHSASIGLTLRVMDAIAIITSGLACFWWFQNSYDLPRGYKNALLLGMLIAEVTFASLGAYRGWRGTAFLSELKTVIIANIITFGLLIFSAFLTQSSDSYSREWTFAWFTSSLILIVTARYSLRKVLGFLRGKGFNARRILIVGDGELGQQVAAKLILNPNIGLTVSGFVTDKQAKIKTALPKSVPVVGDIKDLDRLVTEYQINQVWIALPMSEAETMQDVQKALHSSAAIIRMVPDLFGFRLLNQSMTEVAGMPIINVTTSPMMEGKNRFIKSIEDKVLASIILLCISPIMLILALAVKLTSPGPVFYKQERVSWNGKAFNMLKFRSMSVDSEKDGVKWGGATTMSVTPIGAFIRKTSLDELPQFINVLKGDMSIVGPRPERTVFVDQFKHEIPGYMQKHMVKAGITGWAQINGWRGDTDLEKRIEFDLHYIENWSLWLDIKIVFLTFWKGFVHKNAA